MTTGAAAPFASAVPVPEMPWKTHPTTGPLMGYAYAADGSNTLDGAMIAVSSPALRSPFSVLHSDATGFFGAVDLPPGDYMLAASFPGCGAATNAFTVLAGRVTRQDVLLKQAIRASR